MIKIRDFAASRKDLPPRQQTSLFISIWMRRTQKKCEMHFSKRQIDLSFRSANLFDYKIRSCCFLIIKSKFCKRKTSFENETIIPCLSVCFDLIWLSELRGVRSILLKGKSLCWLAFLRPRNVYSNLDWIAVSPVAILLWTCAWPHGIWN